MSLGMKLLTAGSVLFPFGDFIAVALPVAGDFFPTPWRMLPQMMALPVSC